MMTTKKDGKVKLSQAMREGAIGIEPDPWWFMVGSRQMYMGEEITSATAACDLGCVFIGAIKLGVIGEDAVYEGATRSRLAQYWPELTEEYITDPDTDISGSLGHVILHLNNVWTREQVIAWLEQEGY